MSLPRTAGGDGMSEHEHCWHTGSDMDSAIYAEDRTVTITHFICCHCGQIKVERHEWKRDQELWRVPEQTKHGEHNWQKARETYGKIFA